jgi:hypothetical protein
MSKERERKKREKKTKKLLFVLWKLLLVMIFTGLEIINLNIQSIKAILKNTK